MAFSNGAAVVTKFKFKLGVGLLAAFGAVGALALSDLSPAVDSAKLLSGCLDTPAASASSGESGSGNWQSFLPGMLK